jgi:hypothetical protein
MGLRKQSAVRHLSYQELDGMLRALSEQIRSRTRVTSLTPNTPNDTTVVHLLADMMQLPVTDSGTRVSFYSQVGSEFCFFKLNFTSDLYNREVKGYIDEIEVNDDQTYQKVTLPWKK